MRSIDGELIGFAKVTRDVSDRKKGGGGVAPGQSGACALQPEWWVGAAYLLFQSLISKIDTGQSFSLI
jgi:hypothetical protein